MAEKYFDFKLRLWAILHFIVEVYGRARYHDISMNTVKHLFREHVWGVARTGHFGREIFCMFLIWCDDAYSIQKLSDNALRVLFRYVIIHECLYPRNQSSFIRGYCLAQYQHFALCAYCRKSVPKQIRAYIRFMEIEMGTAEEKYEGGDLIDIYRARQELLSYLEGSGEDSSLEDGSEGGENDQNPPEGEDGPTGVH